MRVMRVEWTYLASPKGGPITFFIFLRKLKKGNIPSMTDKKPTRTRITHTPPAPPRHTQLTPRPTHTQPRTQPHTTQSHGVRDVNLIKL